MKKAKSDYLIQSVSRALDILEAFTANEGELGVTELSRRLKLHKNNVFRLLATLKTGRPVKWEFTREEQFIGATTRHQMTTRVKLGAKRDAQRS